LILVKSEGTWVNNLDVEQLYDHRGNEMIIFITVFYDDQKKDILQFTSRLKTTRNEVIVFHLMGERELNLDFEGTFTFQDLETKAVRKVDASLYQKQYLERVNHWLQDARLWMLEKHISYHLTLLSEAFEVCLRNFLSARKSIIR